MSSTTLCSLRAQENCNGRDIQIYFKDTPNPISLCRQCAEKVGVSMIVNCCLQGADVENIFRDIMTTLAHERTRTPVPKT